MAQTTIELFQQSDDFMKETLNNGHFELVLMYYTTMCDTNTIKKEIAHPFALTPSAEDFKMLLSAAVDCSPLGKDADWAVPMLNGYVIVQIAESLYKLKASKPINDKPADSVTETTLQGPQSAFSEDAETNVMIIRKRYPFPSLVAEQLTLGNVSQTRAYVVYDKEKVSPDILQQIKKKLDHIEADIIQAVGQVEALLTGRKIRWLPILVTSERPDRTVLNLSHGKVVLVLDGTPFTLIGPAVFYDFISAMDDIYQPFLVSQSLVILRYIALLLTVSLPALYIAIVSYNPEIFRVQFALSIAGSRAAVPYPSFIEVLIMLFLIEALIEASLRLPRYIGSTATTVGGLILGQAAQQAGLVSSIMIIITSIVAISNFVIPINAMSFAMRIAKYPLILLSSLFGVAGLVTGLFAICLYTANLESFGQPYFRFFLGEPSVSGYKEGDPY